jgi:hypothetical protein
MTTAATGGIRFGGSGFGPEYISRRKRRIDDPERQQSRSSTESNLSRRDDSDQEVFLFTVKDPVRSALNQLMTLIRTSMVNHPGHNELSPEVISGPLGYTSMKAVRPVAYVPTKSVFKPVTR